MSIKDCLKLEFVDNAIVGALAVMFFVASMAHIFAQVGELTNPLVLAMAGIIGGLLGKSIVI